MMRANIPPYIDAAARARDWARARFPAHTEKMLMREAGLSKPKAHRVILGRATPQVVEHLIRVGGRDFIEFVYAGYLDGPITEYWFTPTGIHECPAGHEIFARDRLGAPATSEADHAEYMRRNCGWVAVSLRPMKAIVQSSDTASPKALARLRDWLEGKINRISTVALNGADIDSIAALVELDNIAMKSTIRDATLSRGWKMRKKPLETLTAPHMLAFFEAWREKSNEPGCLPYILARTGALPYASLFRHRSDGAKITLFNGPELGVDQAETLGRELSQRRDRLYSDNLRSRLDGALLQPTYHKLRLPVGEFIWDYGSVAVAEPPQADGSRLMATVVHIDEKVAA